MTSVPYAPRLFQPGSEFVLTPTYVDGKTRSALATENGQLVSRMGTSRELVATGPRRLVTSNLRTLSKALTDSGVTVKAWSFYSGKLPGAEMIFQAELGPEDIFELEFMPSFLELLEARQQELADYGLMRSSEIKFNGERTEFEAVVRAGLHEVWLVDDWDSLEKELRKRYNRGAMTNEVLELSRPGDYPLLCSGLGINVVLGNPSLDSSVWAASPVNKVLSEFEGYRRTRLVDRDLYYSQLAGIS